MTSESAPPTMSSVGAVTCGSAAPARSGRPRRSRHERRRGTRAGAKESDGQLAKRRLLTRPFDKDDEPLPEQRDVEPQMAADAIGGLFGRCEQVSQQSCEAIRVEDARDELIARAVAPTAAAVREDDESLRGRRQTEVSVQDVAARRDPNLRHEFTRP
jgi:hypothetical protein